MWRILIHGNPNEWDEATKNCLYKEEKRMDMLPVYLLVKLIVKWIERAEGDPTKQMRGAS